MRCAPVLGLVFAMALAACGGGSDLKVVGTPQPGLDPNSLVVSDLLFTELGRTERISRVNCSPDFSVCEATVRGYRYTVYLDDSDDADADATLYTSLGTWDHMRMGAVYEHFEGAELTYGIAYGIRYPNSLPLSGSATWRGEMVALDDNKRLVRGDAFLTIGNLRRPRVYAALSANAYPVMVWDGIPLRDGRFEQRWRYDDYIKGEIYGPNAEEAGGVFERYGLIGAFGARRSGR